MKWSAAMHLYAFAFLHKVKDETKNIQRKKKKINSMSQHPRSLFQWYSSKW